MRQRGNIHRLYPHRSNRRNDVHRAEQLHAMHRRHQLERADQAHAHMNAREAMADQHQAEAAQMAARQMSELGGPAPETAPPSIQQGMASSAPNPMGGGGSAFGRG